MPLLSPNQQWQSIEGVGKSAVYGAKKIKPDVVTENWIATMLLFQLNRANAKSEVAIIIIIIIIKDPEG